MNTSPHYPCPFCSMQFEDYEVLRAHVVTEHKNEPLPKAAGSIEIIINDQRFNVQVESYWTLYYLLHDKLGFTGAKQMCDRGACGSCTVIMDGKAILSCMTLAIECDGKHIETVEGVATSHHPLVETYVKHHAMQCGYCTPGFVVTAKALLDKNDDPSLEEIQEALAGNLCRCGTYPQHPKAVLEAAQRMRSGREE